MARTTCSEQDKDMLQCRAQCVQSSTQQNGEYRRATASVYHWMVFTFSEIDVRLLLEHGLFRVMLLSPTQIYILQVVGLVLGFD